MTTTTFTSAQARNRSTYRNLTLWTFQGWLAMFFIAAGYGKITESMDNLVALMGWPAMVSENMVRGLGVSELVLALMVLAPLVSWKFGRPLLLLATTGLLAIEVAMLGVHVMGQNIGLSLVNVFLIAITVPVLLGRRS